MFTAIFHPESRAPLLWCRNVVNILANIVARGRIVSYNHNLASLLGNADSKLGASFPHHLGEMASGGSTPAWFLSKGVVLDLRVPIVDSSLSLVLCIPPPRPVEVFSVVVVSPVLKGAFSYKVVR